MTESEDTNEEYTLKKEKVNNLDLAGLFELGTHIQYMRNNPYLQTPAVPSEDGEDENLVSLIQRILRYSDAVDAPKILVSDTEDFIMHLLEKYDPNDLVDNKDSEKASSIADRWNDVVIKKTESRNVIQVTETGFISISDKLDRPENFFGMEVWEWLPEQSKRDLDEGLRDLAVESPISSVMVTLRAAENILRIWHNEVCEHGNKIDSGNWGYVFNELDDIYDHDEDTPEVLTDFSYLKERRNEVSHPDESPDMEEAQVNIIRVKATIERVYEELEESES
jgi:hypothetical protein